ncbi:hypothetical protein CJ030_MR7G014408 [Morella rubra]|uniref:Wall-associated receptor kinase galacturonan-binding domain-containing protein n=1 Tax=Morella rubra TaxID=262757 RepID=A0A6A1UKR9_9ROSI|nr:hypothetical protein CJ030_MR0G014428 [Morella rubra]KAB1206263.1 hypothetical protein CJ030_MR7G014408 [Morella rubra]
MDVSLEMVISYFFLVVVFLVDLGDGQKYDCPELSCGSSGLPIRFPFRLNSQPEYLCGYPGFNLSCTHRNETWFTPACGHCAGEGKKCRLKNNRSESRTECFPEQSKDVYSLGMLLLEIVGGRKNTDLTSEKSSQVYFPKWIYNLLEQKDDLRLYVEDDGDAEIAKKLAVVGHWCIQWHPMDRPSMKLAVQMLEGEGKNLTLPPNPFTSTGSTRIKASMHPRSVN